ncbi:MAG: hypothetical protein V1872_11335 [bacterium]
MRFEINFSKIKSKKKKSEGISLSTYFDISITLISLGLLTIAMAVFVKCYYLPQKEDIRRKKDEIAREKVELQSKNDERNRVAAQRTALERLQREKVLWTDKLAALPRLLPKKVWLDNLSAGRSGLTVKGTTYSRFQEKDFYLIGEFMLSIMTNRAFAEDFEPTTLKYSRVPNIADEKMTFELSASLK